MNLDMPLQRDTIAQMLPQAGQMMLLEEVLSWSSETISCSASNHRDQDNPLRVGGTLPVYAGVEYAAQAMALHNYLVLHGQSEAPPGAPRQGVVAVVSKIKTEVGVLHDLPGALEIEVVKIDDAGASSLYRFDLASASKLLISGRLLVSLV